MTTEDHRDAPVQVWLGGQLVASFAHATVVDVDPETGAGELELQRGWSADPRFLQWADRLAPAGDDDRDGRVDLVVDIADQPGALYARHALRGCWASSFASVDDELGTGQLITSLTIEADAVDA